MPEQRKNILVTRTDRIGDVILSLPVAGAIKDAIPSARVTFLVGDMPVPVVRMCPWVDDIIVTGSCTGSDATLDEITSRHFDAVVCLYPRSELARLLLRAKIPVRVGTARRFYSYRFNRRINISRKKGGRHERDFNLALLKGLQIPDPKVPDPVCIPSHEARASARITLGELGIEPGNAFAVVHPGCGGSARNWTPERYRELCRRLHDAGVAIVLSGSEIEKELVDHIKDGIGNRIYSVAGSTGLDVLAAVLQESRVFIGPSTGPMHLAAAVGTPVVALFGPVRTTGADRWGPLGEGHKVFAPAVETCRCPVDACRLGDCMALIDPGEVAAAVTSAMAQPRREFNPASQVFEFERN